MSYGANLHQAEAGKKSIGAVATEKVQSDSLNLGFPSAYQSMYVATQRPLRYFPERQASPMGMWAGTDLQASYHQQKKADADIMAVAKVRATQLSRNRYVGTPHGRGILPEAVLSQRTFANENNGAFTAASARQDYRSAPFNYEGSDYISHYTGGVLRSAEGQAHGKRVLMDRIGQLDAIAAQQSAFTSDAQMPVSTGEPTQSINPTATSPSIELNLLLQQIQDSLIQGEGGEKATKLDKFDLATASRALGLIFRLVPDADTDFVEDLLAKTQNILQLLNGALDVDAESAGFSASARETALSLQVLFTKLDVYLTRMIAGAPVERQETRFNPLTQQQEVVKVLAQEQGQNLSAPERVGLSKNLVSSLGFSKMLKYASTANDSGLLNAAQRAKLFTAQQAQRFREGDMDSDDEDDDSDFDQPNGPRENEAHDRETGVSRSARDFDADERQTFGFNSGMYFNNNGRGEEEYFDEPRPTQTQLPTHRNVERTRREPEVRSRFDPDTQGFNLDIRGRKAQLPLDTAEAIERQPRATRSVVTTSTMREAREAGIPSFVGGPPMFRAAPPMRDILGLFPTPTQSRAPSRRSRAASVPSRATSRVPSQVSTTPSARARRVASSTASSTILPAPPPLVANAPLSNIRRRADLPTTRQGFLDLAAAINQAGGIDGVPIRAYAGSSVENIRRNFIKRLNLVV